MVPDMITFAKAVTSGYQQVGGVIVGQQIRQPLESDESFILRHGYTYSGHATPAPLRCATSTCSTTRRCWPAPSHSASDSPPDSNRSPPMVRSTTRRHGSGVGGGLRTDQDAVAVRDADARRRRRHPLHRHRHVHVLPPLVTTDEQIDRIIDTLATAVA